MDVRSNGESSQGAPSRAESTLLAIVKLLNENANKTPSSVSSDSSLSIDSSTQLISRLNAIVKDYREQIGDIPFSGVDGLDIQLPSYNNDQTLINNENNQPDPLDQQIRDSTHPLIRSEEHVEIDEFVRDMMAAGRKTKPRKLKYNNVEVMIITWEEEQDSDDE